MDAEFMVTDVFEDLRPKMKLSSTLEEAELVLREQTLAMN